LQLHHGEARRSPGAEYTKTHHITMKKRKYKISNLTDAEIDAIESIEDAITHKAEVNN
jgi:hypothetical protein